MFVLKNPARLFQSYRDFCFFLFCSKQFLYTDKFYTEYEDFCCLCKFINCREGRCNTDIAVFWILSVWECCSGTCHNQTSFFCFCTIAFAQPSIESKEIKYPPSGFVHVPIPSPPISFSRTSSTFSNFGAKDSSMFSHMLIHSPAYL